MPEISVNIPGNPWGQSWRKKESLRVTLLYSTLIGSHTSRVGVQLQWTDVFDIAFWYLLTSALGDAAISGIRALFLEFTQIPKFLFDERIEEKYAVDVFSWPRAPDGLSAGGRRGARKRGSGWSTGARYLRASVRRHGQLCPAAAPCVHRAPVVCRRARQRDYGNEYASREAGPRLRLLAR